MLQLFDIQREVGVPGEIRTRDLRFRNMMLYHDMIRHRNPPHEIIIIYQYDVNNLSRHMTTHDAMNRPLISTL